MTDSNAVTAEILRMTAQVVAAYVSNNPVPAQQLGEVIRSIHLEGLTHADVAERVGCSEAQSRGRLFLALARLAAHLKASKQT